MSFTVAMARLGCQTIDLNDLLERISQEILDKEVIEGDDLKTLLAESVLPAEAQLVA